MARCIVQQGRGMLGHWGGPNHDLYTLVALYTLLAHVHEWPKLRKWLPGRCGSSNARS